MKESMILFCDSASGVYTPQRFAEEIKREFLHGVSEDDLNELSDPNNEYYWEAWGTVLNNAEIHDPDGTIYHLHHDGDLWLVCYDLMTDEEQKNFFGEF